MAQALDKYTIQNPKSKFKWSFFVQQPHKQQESRMQQQQKQLGSTYSTGANFSTTVVGNSATKSPNSSVDRKVINTLQIQPIDSRSCDTVKNCTFHSSLVDYLAQVQNRKNEPTLSVGGLG